MRGTPQPSVVTSALALLSSLVQVAGQLRPSSDLVSHCFGFPEDNFDRKNSIEGVYGISPYLPLVEGQPAIDFTLHDASGAPWTLSDALEKGKPVVLVWGMYTCPAYQGLGGSKPFDKCAYWDEYNMVEDHQDKATFVHIYGAEPHPKAPGTNFDSGTMRSMYWSDVSQHQDFSDRLAMMKRIQGLTHPSQALLADYIPGNPHSELVQPVWCSFALGARSVVMVGTDGNVYYQTAWLQTDHVGEAIKSYWEGKSVQNCGGSTGHPCPISAEKGTDTNGTSKRTRQSKKGSLGDGPSYR